jgi:hypothetical protein
MVQGTLRVFETLTAVPGNWSNSPVFEYQWLLDSTPIPNATNAQYTLKAGDEYKRISVRVTATKLGYTSSSTTSVATIVQPADQTLTPEPLLTGEFMFGETLSIDPGIWDDGVAVQISWLRDGKPIAGATAETYVLVADDIGKLIWARVTANKLGFAQVRRDSQAGRVVAATMQTKVIRINGSVKVGGTISAASSAWVAGASVKYQWLLDGKVISGATRATYKLLATQKGKKISCRITQTATGYKSAIVTTTAVKVG